MEKHREAQLYRLLHYTEDLSLRKMKMRLWGDTLKLECTRLL